MSTMEYENEPRGYDGEPLFESSWKDPSDNFDFLTSSS